MSSTGGGIHGDPVNITHGQKTCDVTSDDLKRLCDLLPDGDPLKAVLEQLLAD